MTEKEYKEYIEECNKSIDDFNRIAKRLGVDPPGGDVPINMAFVLKLLRAIERVLDSQPCEDAVSRQDAIKMLNTMDRYVADKLRLCDTNKEFPSNEVFIVDDVYEGLDLLPPVTSTRPTCRECKCWTENQFVTNIGHCDIFETSTIEAFYCGYFERGGE